VAFNALLLFSDIAPNFVQFQAASADANHHPVMQFGAAATDAGTKAHDGIAVMPVMRSMARILWPSVRQARMQFALPEYTTRERGNRSGTKVQK
jgi:hypothetical protein